MSIYKEILVWECPRCDHRQEYHHEKRYPCPICFKFMRISQIEVELNHLGEYV